jgi:large subunit ribosomal protein L14
MAITLGTNLIVADNSGALLAQCIKIIGGTSKKASKVAQVVVLTIKKANPNSKVKKGTVCKGLIVRTAFPIRRKDGTVLRFDSSSVVIIDKQGEPIGTRVFGPVAREVRNAGYVKIASLAEEVL